MYPMRRPLPFTDKVLNSEGTCDASRTHWGWTSHRCIWEYVSHLDAAKSLGAGTDVTHKEAWSMACARSSDPKSNLETVISAWLATICSSSGVEQNFSKGAWGYNCRQLKASVQHERSTHRVLLYDGPLDSLIKGALKCWRRCFGIVRASGSSNRKARADKGTHKRKGRSTCVS